MPILCNLPEPYVHALNATTCLTPTVPGLFANFDTPGFSILAQNLWFPNQLPLADSALRQWCCKGAARALVVVLLPAAMMMMFPRNGALGFGMPPSRRRLGTRRRPCEWHCSGTRCRSWPTTARRTPRRLRGECRERVQ